MACRVVGLRYEQRANKKEGRLAAAGTRTRKSYLDDRCSFLGGIKGQNGEKGVRREGKAPSEWQKIRFERGALKRVGRRSPWP